MSKPVNAIFNIAKMIFWVMIAPALTATVAHFIGLGWIGWVLGVIAFALFTFFWNLLNTYGKVFSQDGQEKANEVVKIIFTTDLTLPITEYGCYCSPKYGVDGRTNGIPPISSLSEVEKKVMLTG